MRQYSNTAVEAELTNSASNVDTSIVVDATTGFPVTFPYTLSIDADNASKELVEVTAAAGTTLTVTRGVDGTSAASHSIGAVVRHDHSARDFREAQEHIAAESDVHGVTGDLVGATQAQVITNKDFTSGTNTFPSSLATDAEVQAVADDLADHLSDAVDAHDASAISFSPAAGIAATNVQAAIVEDAGDLSTHEAASSGVHGVSGFVVGTTSTQTLTNKTMTASTNTFPPFGLRDVVVYTAAGTFNKGDYSYLKYVKIVAVAGGGAGGGATATAAGEGAGGGGGQAGGMAMTYRAVGSLASSETVTVGAGGTGSAGASGSAGGDSSVGTHAVAQGGAGGGAMTAGATTAWTGSAYSSTAGSGHLDTPGGAGEAGARSSAAALGGRGGSSHIGPGAQCRSSATDGSGTGFSAAANTGGGGGGGCNGPSSGTARAGGSGGSGVVYIELYG